MRRRIDDRRSIRAELFRRPIRRSTLTPGMSILFDSYAIVIVGMAVVSIDRRDGRMRIAKTMTRCHRRHSPRAHTHTRNPKSDN